MNRAELLALLRGGENSTVEFKRDDVRNHDLAKELVAFLNLGGGVVLLGVEDDGNISGTTRDDLEERIAELCRSNIEPSVILTPSWVRGAEPGRDVLAVHVTVGLDKPYARVHNNHRAYYIRVGSTSREANREEIIRMSQASGRLHYGVKPVPGADLNSFDLRRLRNYLTHVLNYDAPTEKDWVDWEMQLDNLKLMTESAGVRVATVDGLLLFGRTPERYLPQSGVHAVCYPDVEPSYETRADEYLRGPLVPLGAADGAIVENGLVDQAWDFVRRNTASAAHLEGARRIDDLEYPESAVREALVNALVHRDYSIAGTDVMLAIYADRLEVQSPGCLPNTVTVERMKAGVRYARNQTLVNVMRDYRYVEDRGMGVRNKIIPTMRSHNDTEPGLEEEEHRFTVRLWKKASQST